MVGGRRLTYRQADDKTGPGACLVVLETASVGLNDAFRNTKSQSCGLTNTLGREEWLHDFGKASLGNAVPAIRHGNLSLILCGLIGYLHPVFFQLSDSIDGIGMQIDQYLGRGSG